MGTFVSETEKIKSELKHLTRQIRDFSKDVSDALKVADSIFKRGPKGGYAVREVGQRARRIKLETLLTQAEEFKNRSDKLFWADKLRKENPLHADKSASQIINESNSLISQKTHAAAKILRSQYGLTEEADAVEAEASKRDKEKLDRERIKGAREFPLWKKFFLDSRNEAKDIHQMSETLTSISKIPLVGRLVHTSPLGLGVTLGMAGIAALNELLDKIRNTTVKNVARENAELFYGKPSESFKKALESALISEPAEQAKIWGAFAQRGIPPEVGLGIVGAIARGGNPMMQKKAAESFGLSPNAVIASRFFTGELGINPKTDPARAYAARLNAITVEEEKNWGIGGNRWRAFELWLPYSKEIEARTGKSLSKMAGESATNFAPMMNTRFVNPNAMLPAINKLKAAEEAARASISYDASSAKNVSHVTTIDNKPNVVTYIDNLNLPSVTNQKEFTDEMIKNSKSSNTAILDSFVSFE